MAALLSSALAYTANAVVVACTAVCAVGAGQVLVGNNEDYTNPRTKIWFVPAKPGSYGRMYVGFDDLTPQGGMNERGLWFDGFAAPAMRATSSADLPRFQGNIIDKAMAECATVEEVVALFNRHNRAFLTEAILMFADASGDAVAIEPDAMVRKTGKHFVQTNFHQSLRNNRAQDGRFKTAWEMLGRAGDDVSVDLIRQILAATHQKGFSPTLYSNVYDLRSRTMHLYHFHDFDRAVTFRLDDELKKGERVLDIPALFPPNADADAFAARREKVPRIPKAVLATGAIGFVAVLVGIVGYGVVRGGRRLRIGIVVLLAAATAIVVLTAVALDRHAPASPEWIEFSMGPASGDSASIGSNRLRSNGITLKTALATAYDIPAVRIIGPAWLSETRYSMNAVIGVDAQESFRSLLQQELKNRLGVEAHLEGRPFDVFVLTARRAARLEAAHRGPSIWVARRDAHLQGASMADLASALQSILGKPVIDETGISGTYNLEFGWGEDRVASVTAVLDERFGLDLAPGQREMEVLIIDKIQRDPALTLLGHVGRITRRAPQQVREHVADALTIR